MSYREHAMREFETVGWIKDGKWQDGMQKMMCEQVLELLDLFSAHGHSGFSAPYAIKLFKTLASFEPIGGISGADNEWEDIDEEIGKTVYQNKRLSSVFKRGKDGKPYFMYAIVWREKDGDSFTGMVEGIKSSQEIKSFPFVPKSFYIDVVEDENGDHKIKDMTQLEAVKEVFNLAV